MTSPLSDRVISPERRALSELRAPLTSGEHTVIAFFDRTLEPDWEIYVQPHLNGLRPDVVLLHPRNGIAVYEIKDWSLSSMHYEYRTPRGSPELWCRDQTGKWFRRDDPVSKVIRYKKEIQSLYCPSLGAQLESQPGAASAITAGVILTRATTAEASELFAPVILALELTGAKANYQTVTGGDALSGDRLDQVFPWAEKKKGSRWMNEDVAQDLRSWLVEPDHAAAQRDPLPMDPRQRELATTRTASGYRRVRGPAGSGKSLALAARAAQLSAEGKAVLVVSFNITLLHYLRDLAVRYPEPKSSIVDRITWLHFHGWCKRTCEESGRAQEYQALWRAHFEGSDDPDQEALGFLLETDLPSLVADALRERHGKVAEYDAVLCDEAQDLNLDWWNLLRQVVRSDGEMMLAADRTQDIYGQAAKWTDVSLENAGFPGGRWYELEGSYRFPVALIPHLRHFLQVFLPGEHSVLPTAVQGDLLEPVHLEWVQVSPEALVAAAIDAIRTRSERVNPQELKWSDLAIVAQTHRVGSRIVEDLGQLGIRSCHVFGDSSSSRARKAGFWMGDARVKAATLHSFKGWESSYLVVLIEAARGVNDFRAIYVALSRLRRNTGGSTLLVVCAAPELAQYGKTWPIFRDTTSRDIHDDHRHAT